MNPDLIPFDPKKVELIRRSMCVIENDNNSPEIQYGALYRYRDGTFNGQKVHQYTLSIGFTETGSNLSKVIKRYADAGGTNSAAFAPYTQVIGKRLLGDDRQFEDLIKRSAGDPVMQQVQKDAFDDLYLEPAFKWATSQAMVLPLTYLVVTDSYLHSGCVFDWLRKRFPAAVPKNGGKEEDWTTQYCKARYDWLNTHSDKLLRNTAFRAQTWLRMATTDNNWQLDQVPFAIRTNKINYA